MLIIKCASVQRRDNCPSLNWMVRRSLTQPLLSRSCQHDMRRIWMPLWQQSNETCHMPWLLCWRIIWFGLFSIGALSIPTMYWKVIKWICNMPSAYVGRTRFWILFSNSLLVERLVHILPNIKCFFFLLLE